MTKSKKKVEPTPPQWPKRLPHVMVIAPHDYRDLHRLVSWFEAAPSSFEMGESATEHYSDLLNYHLESCEQPLEEEFVVLDVQIESEQTAMHGCHPGDLVALVGDECDPDAEWHLLIRRRDPT